MLFEFAVGPLGTEHLRLIYGLVPSPTTLMNGPDASQLPVNTLIDKVSQGGGGERSWRGGEGDG